MPKVFWGGRTRRTEHAEQNTVQKRKNLRHCPPQRSAFSLSNGPSCLLVKLGVQNGAAVAQSRAAVKPIGQRRGPDVLHARAAAFSAALRAGLLPPAAGDCFSRPSTPSAAVPHEPSDSCDLVSEDDDCLSETSIFLAGETLFASAQSIPWLLLQRSCTCAAVPRKMCWV